MLRISPLWIFLLSAAALWAQDSNNVVKLIKQVAPTDFSSQPAQLNDMWGVLGPNGEPIFLVGHELGTQVIDASDPSQPVDVGFVPGPPSIWRDIKSYVYNPDPENYRAYAFAVTEEHPGGIQIIDLSNLPTGIGETTTYDGIHTAHNIFIEPDNSDPIAYACVAHGRGDSGLAIIDISDPDNPSILSRWTEASVHDVYVSKTWADPAYNGKRIAIAFCEESYIAIIDVSDPTQPETIQRVRYDGLFYSHSGWTDPSGRYLYASDELDEINVDINTHIYIFDLADLTAPQQLPSWIGPNRSSEHNMVSADSYLFISHYTRGLVVLDISQPEQPFEVGNVDSQPDTDVTGVLGAWGVYAFPDQNLIGISDTDNGLFIAGLERPPFKLVADRMAIGLTPTATTEVAIRLETAPGVAPVAAVSVEGLPAGVRLANPVTLDQAGNGQLQLVADASVTDYSGTITLRAESAHLDLTLNVATTPPGPKPITPVNGDLWLHPETTELTWAGHDVYDQYEVILEPLDGSETLTFKSFRTRFQPLSHLVLDQRYRWQVRAIDPAGQAHTSAAAEFETRRPPLLLVNDAGFDPVTEAAFDTWLDSGSVPRDIYRPQADSFLSVPDGTSMPRPLARPTEVLANYPLIFWTSGTVRSTNENPLAGPNEAESTQLGSYLDAGGMLIMDGRDYFHDVGETLTPFMSERLGIGTMQGDVTEFRNLGGLGSLQALGDFELGDLRGGGWEDAMVPNRDAQAALIDPDTGQAAAVETANSLFFSFPFERLANSQPERADYILRQSWDQAMRNQATPDYTQRWILPLRPADLELAPTLHLIDAGGTGANVQLRAFTGSGELLIFALPRLPVHGKVRIPLQATLSGFGMDWQWVHLSADAPVVGSLDARAADRGFATPLSPATNDQLVIPHIAADTASFFTQAQIVNTAEMSATLELTSFGNESWTFDPLPIDGSQRLLFNSLFDQNIDASRTAAIASASGLNLAGAEVFGTQTGDQLAALTLSGQLSQQLVFSHIANVAGGWWTGLAIVNPNNQPTTLLTQARDSNGALVAENTLELQAMGKILTLVDGNNQADQLFPDGLPATAVSILVSADQPITGYELFGDAVNRQFAGLQAGQEPQQSFILPFAGDANHWAGLAMVNPNDIPVTARIHLIDDGGEERGVHETTLQPGARFLALSRDLFNPLPTDGFLKINADGALYGFQLYGPNHFAWLAGLNGLPVP